MTVEDAVVAALDTLAVELAHAVVDAASPQGGPSFPGDPGVGSSEAPHVISLCTSPRKAPSCE